MLQRIFTLLAITTLTVPLHAQHKKLNYNLSGNADSGTYTYTLEQCIGYALQHQPAIKQAHIDEQIARANRSIAVAGWMPQVTGTANYQHYIELPTSFLNINGTLTPLRTGIANTSTPGVAVTQNIFSNETLLASRAGNLNMQLASQNTRATQIDLVANVSKAFYDVLLSVERIHVYMDDTARLRKNRDDAYHRFVSGVSDKVDLRQATIAINNSLAQLKTATEELNARNARLKALMGAPIELNVAVTFDTAQMMRVTDMDTNAVLHMEKRIEFEQLELTRKIQHLTTAYYNTGFLPSLSAFYNYNHQFLSKEFSELYNKAYPNSLFGLQLSVPIFTGLRRLDNIHKARLQEERIDWDEVNLKLNIYSEYRSALAGYKSNLYNFHTQAENVAMAREVYNIVKLQYNEGIKPYLDVIVAESDLQNSEINYLNALFELLQSKVDLDKAMGNIVVE